MLALLESNLALIVRWDLGLSACHVIIDICRHHYWVICQEVVIGIFVHEGILGQVFVVVEASREVAVLGQTCR